MPIKITYSSARPVDDRYRPSPAGEDEAVSALFVEGRLSADNPILGMYQDRLASYFGAEHAVPVNSGTSALHAVLHTVGACQGREVIVPASAWAAAMMPLLTCGATPVIVDVQADGLSLDPQAVAAVVTGRTVAAITVPRWGYPTDDTAAAQILADHGVPLIEYAAQAHGTVTVGGRLVGARYDFGCFSTHDRTLLATGEGGFVLTPDGDQARRLEQYTHLGRPGGGYGVNYKLAAPLAAIGLRRLRALNEQLAARARNVARMLEQLAADGPVRELATVGGRPNYYQLVLTVLDEGDAATAAARMAEAGLPPDSVRFKAAPLYEDPLFAAYRSGDCPNAQRLLATSLQFPTHPGLSGSAIEWITEQIGVLSGGRR